MANRIKGITVEIGGDTTGLDKALQKVNSSINKTQSALNDVNRLLKLDPTNTTLVAQKQELLSQAISQTSEKLKSLEDCQNQVKQSFENGDIGKDKFMAFQREIEETRAKLKQYQTELSNLNTEFKNVGDTAKKTSEDISEITKATKGDVLLSLADNLSDVGDKIKDIGTQSINAYTQSKDAIAKVNAYFGETGKIAEESADIIKEIYYSGIGDSLDTVANAIVIVKKNLGDLNKSDLTNITKQVITLDNLYGIDMNETLRGVNSLMKQYGLSAQESLDYIVKGTQNGLDKTNELGDNLSEYSGKFAQAGYSASEYFQLLDNGLKSGAYNLDKVNDSINEVTTRLADGTISDNISLFSDKTQELFLLWQNGGATQKQVIDSIVADISNCKNQQDALNMSATAFGTMAEDGNLKFITSLTSVGNIYQNVTNSAQGLFDTAISPTQTMESNTRKLQQSLSVLGEKISNLVNTILPPLVAIISKVSDLFSKLPEPVQNFTIILGALIVAFTTLVPIIAALAVSIGALEVSILPIIAIIVGLSAVIAGVIAIVENWGAITQWFGDLWTKICTGIGQTIENVKNKVSSVLTNIKDTVLSVFDKIKNTSISIWNGIKNAIITPIENAKDKIKNIVDSIKGFFDNMKISLPNIKLPHFSLQGSFSLSPPSVPKLSIDWYKDGGIMTKPTVFGLNGSSLMAGGEAGAEAILPLKSFYTNLENILSSKLNTNVIERYLSEIALNSSKGLYLEDGTLVGHLLPTIDNRLGKLQQLNRRLSL